MKKAKQTLCIIALIFIVSVFFVGCSINDSLGSGDELDLLKMHPEDRVYKVYYGVGWPKFFGKLYNGDVSLDSINDKLDTEHINDPEYQDEYEDVCCVGYGYIVRCNEYNRSQYIHSCSINGEEPTVMPYIYDTGRVFDGSVKIKEAYVLAEQSSYNDMEYIYFVTDEGDYIFIKNEEYVGENDDRRKQTAYYLVPADEYGKYCAEVFAEIEERGEQSFGQPDFVSDFENIESYRHTEPFKPE